MNKTHFEHMGIALVVQIIFLTLFGLVGGICSGLFISGVFFGREYSQVERKIELSTDLETITMMPWDVFQWEYWTLDNIIDFVAPTVISILTVAIFILGGFNGIFNYSTI